MVKEDRIWDGTVTDTHKHDFKERGYVYIKNFYNIEGEIAEIKKDIYNLIRIIIKNKNLGIEQAPFSAEQFDSGLGEILRRHRDLAATLYNAVKKLPSYVRLAHCTKHEILARELLETNFLGFANRGYGIRMDHPSEDHYLTQWHQDYVSQLCAPNGLVLWSPLRDVTADLGPLCFCPGSHKDGVFKIRKYGPGSDGLKINNEKEIIDRYESLAPDVAVGDVVVLDFKTLHCSSPNRSSSTRWSMISRYFDFLDPIGISYGWRGGLQEGGNFEQMHPELTVTD